MIFAVTVTALSSQVVAIASSALDGFRNEAKKMVVALVDMERAFVPPQHFIRLVQRRYSLQLRYTSVFVLPLDSKLDSHVE